MKIFVVLVALYLIQIHGEYPVPCEKDLTNDTARLENCLYDFFGGSKKFNNLLGEFSVALQKKTSNYTILKEKFCCAAYTQTVCLKDWNERCGKQVELVGGSLNCSKTEYPFGKCDDVTAGAENQNTLSLLLTLLAIGLLIFKSL